MPCLLKEVGDEECCVRSPDICPDDVRAMSGVLCTLRIHLFSLGASPPEQMFRSLRLLFQDSCLLGFFFKLIFVEVSTDYNKYTNNEFC